MILATYALPIPEGSFGIIIEDNIMRVPERLAQLLNEQGVTDPDEFLAHLAERREFMRKLLDWEMSSYLGALEELRAQLLARVAVA